MSRGANNHNRLASPDSLKVYPMNVYLIFGARKVRGVIVASVACWAALLGCVAAAAETKPLRLQIDQDVSIEVRGHTIATYRATPSPSRPFLRELWTPGGVQVLRDSPHDHKHHHGMMFALSVDEIDFWSDEPTSGRQVPKALEDVQVGGAAGTSRVGFTQPVDWVAPGGTVSLHERRTITAFADPTIDATLLTWRSCLSAPGARPVKLGGTDYVGLGTRFVVSMDGKGRFFNSAGQEGKPRMNVQAITGVSAARVVEQGNGHGLVVGGGGVCAPLCWRYPLVADSRPVRA